MFLTRFLKLFVLVAVGLFSYEAAAGVSIENRELVYEGPISAKNNERAITLYEAAVDKPSTLVITSGGGNVDLGMDLGEFILEHDLDVKVNTFCFSSCANYVFTAGKNKWVGENAILGWHGDAASAYWRDSDINAMVRHLEGEEKSKEWQELRQHYDDITRKSVVREKQFFKRISTDHALLTIGLSKDLVKAAVKQKARGWTVTPALLEKMGVSNIKFISSPWQPKNNPRFPLLILQ
ncbi:hypothetical protein [Alteromonas mediterranea]|uniref:hypothetical protein n=1 Tax=Alteromonas mediterranea TaxID=314275 RepID=UPI002FE23736